MAACWWVPRAHPNRLPDQRKTHARSVGLHFKRFFRSRCGSAIRPRIEDDLGAMVLLVAEYLVHLRRLSDRNTMADHEARVDLAALHAIEQRFHVAHHVGLPGLHGD